ncbi:MAG: diguanylate cyclase [Symploca sp. SIO2G7]|nr:diguanylate cyclase [Symploca sp. SIO2G7]
MAKILIVENEMLVAWHIQEALEKLGHNIIASVTSGIEAIQVPAAIKPDLVLMDIQLEDNFDGIAAAQEIHDRYDIPVIYLTAHTDDDTLQRALKTNPFGYLIKPFQEKQLHITITIALHRHQLEKYLEDTKQQLVNTITSVRDATIATDHQGYITFINSTAASLTGWHKKKAIGKNINRVLTLINPKTHKEIKNPVVQGIQRGTNIKFPNSCLLLAKNGKEIPISETAALIRNGNGEIVGSILVFQDITKQQQIYATRQQREFDLLKTSATKVNRIIQQKEFSQAVAVVQPEMLSVAFVDNLTQVANRCYFDNYMKREWKKLAQGETPISLVLCDLDFFKAFNQIYGYQAGNDCLQKVACAIRQVVESPENLLARYSDKEFVVVLPNIRVTGGMWLAQKIRARLKQLKLTHVGSTVNNYVTLSLGVASMVPHLGSSPATLMAAAKEALAQAKAEGGDRVIIRELD